MPHFEIIFPHFQITVTSLNKHFRTSKKLSLPHIEISYGWRIILPPVGFPFNISEMVKAVSLAFWSIQQYFIRDIHAKFGIPNFPQSILDKTQTGVFAIFTFLVNLL